MTPTPRMRRNVGVILAFAVVPPVLTHAAPGVLTPVRANDLGTAAAFAAAAIALNLLMGYAGQISLGHAAFLGIGAFTSGLLTGRGPQVPMLAGLIAAAIAGAVFAFAIGIPALRLRGLYLAIATIGFSFMMQQSLFRWGPVSGGSAGVELPRPRFGDVYLRENGDYLAIMLVVAFLVWILDENVVRTKIGRAFHAIRTDEPVAQSFGIDVARYKLLAFVLSGAIAGVAGALYAHMIGFVNSDTFDFQRSLLLVVMVVVGGLGSRTGVVVSAVVYSILPQMLKWLAGWDQIIGAALLIDVMARHPGGIAQAIRDAKTARAIKAARAAGTNDAPDPVLPKLPDLPRPHGLLPRPQVLAGAPLLEVRDVSVRFGGLQALDKASLVVPKGKIVGLIGPNGAGKSTLFNAVSGLVRAEGRVTFMGRDITALAPDARARLGIGRTFQMIGLAKDRSVHENFLLAQHAVASYGTGAALLALPSAARVERELEQRATQAIEALGFERYAETPVRNLSHGQQRIVELGCALVTAPELLMLDEPSAGMAPAAVESLAQRLRDIRDELGRTVLLIEHHIPLVLDVCDEIYVLNFGRVLAHGSTDEVARQPEVMAAYFGEGVSA